MRINRALTRELPDNYPFAVQQAYISLATSKWLDPALNLFDAINTIQTEYVQKIVLRHFGHFGHGVFQRMVM
jgi:hypothetical protein